jgi:hypothetical protein
MVGRPGEKGTGNRGFANRATAQQEGGNARGMHADRQGMVLWLRDRSGMTAQRHICPEGTSKVAVKASHQVAPAGGCSMSVGD